MRTAPGLLHVESYFGLWSSSGLKIEVRTPRTGMLGNCSLSEVHLKVIVVLGRESTPDAGGVLGTRGFLLWFSSPLLKVSVFYR